MNAPFKPGQRVVYDNGARLIVEGCFIYVKGTEWFARVRDPRDGVKYDLECSRLTPNFRLIEGGLSNATIARAPCFSMGPSNGGNAA